MLLRSLPGLFLSLQYLRMTLDLNAGLQCFRGQYHSAVGGSVKPRFDSILHGPANLLRHLSAVFADLKHFAIQRAGGKNAADNEPQPGRTIFAGDLPDETRLLLWFYCSAHPSSCRYKEAIQRTDQCKKTAGNATFGIIVNFLCKILILCEFCYIIILF